MNEFKIPRPPGICDEAWQAALTLDTSIEGFFTASGFPRSSNNGGTPATLALIVQTAIDQAMKREVVPLEPDEDRAAALRKRITRAIHAFPSSGDERNDLALGMSVITELFLEALYLASDESFDMMRIRALQLIELHRKFIEELEPPKETVQ